MGTFEFVVAAPGEQTDPSIEGQYIVYAGPGAGASDGLDVFLYDLALPAQPPQVIAGGPGNQDQPDVHLSFVTYRGPRGAYVQQWFMPGELFREPAPAGDGAVADPAIGSEVAAWTEAGPRKDRDIRVSRYHLRQEYALVQPDGSSPLGDQHSPSAFGRYVAYVDDLGIGAARVHDSSELPSHSTVVCEGRVTGVSMGSTTAGEPVVAVARDAGSGDEDIEVYGLDGTLLAALRVAGVQHNPHLSGEWVAFEDTSTTFSQVVVWRWRNPAGESPLVFVPHPSETQQTLNDASLAAGDEVRVAFVDSASPETGRDIALYRLGLAPLVFDDAPDGFPILPPPPPPPPDGERASCDKPESALATLELAREEGKPQAAEVAFVAEIPSGRKSLPVLVCVDARHVSAAWVTLEDEAIATPSDFNPHVEHLELLAEVEADAEGCSVKASEIAAVIAGTPGAWLRVRVLPDPARGEDGGDGSSGTVTPAPAPAPAVAPAPASSGCGTAGGSAFGSLAALGLLLVIRKRR